MQRLLRVCQGVPVPLKGAAGSSKNHMQNFLFDLPKSLFLTRAMIA